MTVISSPKVKIEKPKIVEEDESEYKHFNTWTVKIALFKIIYGFTCLTDFDLLLQKCMFLVIKSLTVLRTQEQND